MHIYHVKFLKELQLRQTKTMKIVYISFLIFNYVSFMLSCFSNSLKCQAFLEKSNFRCKKLLQTFNLNFNKRQLLRTDRTFCRYVTNQIKENLILFHFSCVTKPLCCFCQKLWTRKGDMIFQHLHVEYTPH